MAPTESELTAIRLARIRALLDSLESECNQSADAQATFDKIKTEMEKIRLGLPIKP